MFGLKYVTGSGEGLLQSFDDISSDEVLYASFGVRSVSYVRSLLIEFWTPKLVALKDTPKLCLYRQDGIALPHSHHGFQYQSTRSSTTVANTNATNLPLLCFENAK